jgi:hypothetical protein
VYDTLYIADIIAPILNLAETKTTVSCILKSGIPEHWGKCANDLSVPADILEMYKSQARFEKNEISTEIISSNTSFSVGIENQKRQLML